MTQDKTPELKAFTPSEEAFEQWEDSEGADFLEDDNESPLSIAQKVWDAAWEAAEAQDQKGDDLERAQQPLGKEFADVLYMNLSSRYETDEPTPEPQGAAESEFEKYPKLAARIQHMAAHATSYSMHDWHLFLDEVNAALIQSATRQQDSEKHRNDLMDKIVAPEKERRSEENESIRLSR